MSPICNEIYFNQIKMNQESKKVKAIDLMMVDLHTRHSEIRNEARQFQCEDELDELKNLILELLKSKREEQ